MHYLLTISLFLSENSFKCIKCFTPETSVWVLDWCQQTSIKGQIVNVLGFVGHVISIIITQLCFCCIKAAIDNTQINDHG